jgi:hypothetical protein
MAHDHHYQHAAAPPLLVSNSTSVVVRGSTGSLSPTAAHGTSSPPPYHAHDQQGHPPQHHPTHPPIHRPQPVVALPIAAVPAIAMIATLPPPLPSPTAVNGQHVGGRSGGGNGDAAAAAAAVMTVFEWQWLDQNDGWVAYDSRTCHIIEHALLLKKVSVPLRAGLPPFHSCAVSTLLHGIAYCMHRVCVT